MTDLRYQGAASFIKNISFRSVKPLDPLSLPAIPPEVRRCLEFANTDLPADEDKIRGLLEQIWNIPKMSTFAIGAIINKIVSILPPNACYLNIGVWEGYTFLCGMIDNPQCKCVGVDNFSQFGGPKDAFMQRFNALKSDKHYFFEMDYATYFEQFHNMPIGLYFYDGAHDYANQQAALEKAAPFIMNGGYIMVDDINWAEPYRATLDFVSQHGGQYQVILDQKTAGNGHPTYWNGLIILRKY